MACHTPPLERAKKQGEMPLRSLSPITFENRLSLFGGLDSGLDCGTGLRDWTHRKLRSSNFEAAHTLLHYSILTSHELNSGQTAITRYQYR